MIKHMDEYTILYQTKSYITSEKNIKTLIEEDIAIDTNDFEVNREIDAKKIRKLALKWLELGVREIKYEYPPNVSRRMEKYYHNNKHYLAQALTPHIEKVMHEYKHIH